MKLGWLMFQYAPPDLKLTRAQKRDARKRTWRAYRTTFSSLLISFSTATVLGIIYGAAFMLPDFASVGLSGFVRIIIIPAALVLITWLLIAWACRSIYVRANRQALREMGFALCLGCGYSLQGLGESVKHCPECGAEREA